MHSWLVMRPRFVRLWKWGILVIYWQNGYGAFSVNPSEISVVKKYIDNQEEHHKKRNFKNEYRAFLKKYEVEYDERYVWD